MEEGETHGSVETSAFTPRVIPVGGREFLGVSGARNLRDRVGAFMQCIGTRGMKRPSGSLWPWWYRVDDHKGGIGWIFLAAIPVNALWGLAGPPSQSMTRALLI
jgi:hypothetical protein